jgi:Ni/Fe-hydrogenase subunit HybB-like protein
MIRRTLIDNFLGTGLPGQLGLLFVIAGVIVALRIHSRRRGMRHRLAFLACSFLPVLTGLFKGCSMIYADIVWGHNFDPRTTHGEPAFWIGTLDGLVTIQWTAMETLILVVISLLLFLDRGAKGGVNRPDLA